MSDFKIIGNHNPVVGVVEFYTVNNLYPKISVDQKFSAGGNAHLLHQIKWEVYVLEFGKWRKTKENDKIGNQVTYKFRHGSLTRDGIRIVAVKGNETAWLEIKSLPAPPKIDDVKLLDKNGKKIEGRLSYGQTVKTRVHCLQMEKRRVYVTLWEDDVKGAGHNKANEKNFIETRSGIVKDGIADIDFLLKPSFAKIAVKNGPENDKVHEYYVTAELDKEKIPSNNINVNAPETPVAIYKAKTTPKEAVKINAPVQQHKTNTAMHHAPSVPKYPAPSEQKPTVKSRINSVNITDTAGNKIKGVFKEKQIKVWINSTELKNKKVRLKLFDDDYGSDDLLLQKEFIIQSDLHIVVVALDTIPRSYGDNFGEGNEQELFAEVEVLQTHLFTKSAIVDVDATVFKQDPIEVTNKVLKVGKSDKAKNKGTDCVCKENNFYWSNKLTCDERKKVLEVCEKLWGEDKKKDKASELMAIMHLETIKTFSPSKKGISKNGTKFIGLIQFNAKTAKSIGTTYEALGEMTFIEQMKYVEIYLKQNKDNMNTIVDFYLQVIKPSDVGKGNQPNYAVFDESVSVPDVDGRNTSQEQRDKNIQIEPWVTKYGYASNPTFMTEKDEKKLRKRWVYTRQVYEERYGTIGGKTTIKEIDDVLKNEHYKPGATQLFNGKCDDGIEEKKEVANGERAPWMKIVLKEAKNYGGYSEGGDTKLSKRIKAEYFAIKNEGATSKSDPTKISWCAVFASWCLQKAGYSNPSTCRALEFDPDYIHEGPGKEDKKLSHMRKISEPIYGCIIVWKNKKGGGGHVAFYYGKTPEGNIIPIGGNQGSSLQFSNRNPNGDTNQKIIGYFLPDDYPDNPADKFTKAELKLDPVLLNKSELLAKNGFVSTET